MSYQVGGEGAWHVAIQDTHMAFALLGWMPAAHVVFLACRRCIQSSALGAVFGSERTKTDAQVGQATAEIAREERRARPSVVSAEIGKGAAAAMVVARGAEVTPPPSRSRARTPPPQLRTPSIRPCYARPLSNGMTPLR